MYLSKVAINRVDNPYELHRILWRAFPGHAPGTPCPFMFRAANTRNGKTHITMLSEIKPAPAISGMETAEHNRNIVAGRTYVYTLTANPTSSIFVSKDKRGLRKPILHRHGIAAWLRRKLAGASIVYSVSVVNQQPLSFVKDGAKGIIHAATIVGVLKCEDPDALNKIISRGIGRGKSMGCGLLTLAPASSHGQQAAAA